MSVRIHYFKTWPEPFAAAAVEIKLHEIRKDDRPVRPRPGDLLVLQEWTPHDSDCPECMSKSPEHEPGDYTGRELRRRVTFVTIPGTWGIPNDIYVMSIRPEK